MTQTGARSTGSPAPVTATSSGAPRTAISQAARTMLAAAGLASWIGGGAASFLGKGGAAAAALIVAGAVCLVISLVGRWPSRISVSGNELSWDAVKETVQSQIESTEPTDNSEAELKILLDRLTTLQQTGVVPDPPAEIFDKGSKPRSGGYSPAPTSCARGRGARTPPTTWCVTTVPSFSWKRSGAPIRTPPSGDGRSQVCSTRCAERGNCSSWQRQRGPRHAGTGPSQPGTGRRRQGSRLAGRAGRPRAREVTPR